MQILNSLIPIFAVIALGAGLRWGGFLSAELTSGFNRFAYFVALPAFLVYKLGTAPEAGAANRMIPTLMVATLATLAAAWLVAQWWTELPHRRGALIQAAFRGNLAFIGLPLILFVIDGQPEETKAVLEAAILLTMAPVVIVYNLLAVVTLSIYRQPSDRSISWRSIALSLALNPILIGCVVGMLVQKASVPFPVAVERTFLIVGSSAFLLALLGIGSQLASVSVSKQWSGAVLASVLKCVFCPLVGWCFGSWIGLQDLELAAVVILCAVPTSVSSYVLTDQMRGDSELAAGAVVASTLVSLLTLSMVLMWLQ